MPFNYKNLSFSLLLSFLSVGTLYSQNALYGRVIDRKNSEPIEFVQLALMNPTDSSVITGTLTDSDGRFRIQSSQTGNFLIRVSFVGYEEHWETVDLKSGTNRIGYISLAQGSTHLDAVQVTAAAALFRSEADRRIYNVENMTIAEGGTAIDLLETLPSVQLDNEGTLTLRGSGNILIYINGRPTNLSSDETESILEQFPANAIKDVELITNPSARYDAEGVGGIINIVLKEQRLRGFNGQLTTSAGTGNKYTGGVTLNLRQNRWNLTSNYAYQYRERWEENLSLRESYLDGYSPIVDQNYYTENFSQSHLLRLTAENEINDRNAIRFYGSVNARSRDRRREYNIQSLTIPTQIDSMYLRRFDEDQSRLNLEVGTGYHWSNGNGASLNANSTLSWDSQDRMEYFNQQYFNSYMFEVPDKYQNQLYERPQSNRMMVFEVDYEQGMFDNTRMEAGLKSTLRSDDRSQNFGQLNLQNNSYEEVVLRGIPINNHFTRNEEVHAAYLIVSNNNSRLSYMAGLRGELTNTRSWQQYGLRQGFLNDNSMPAVDTTITDTYFNLFPSLYLNYNIGENQDIQVNYSRRIRRPGVWNTNPFINAQDFYNLRIGNPFLQPAFTNNSEINYIRGWEHYMLTLGVFNRHTVDRFTRLFVPFEQGTLVTWTNANTSTSTGLELINYFKFNANTDLTLTGNFYHTLIQGELDGLSFSNENYSWNLSLMGNANIPSWFRFQMSANYWGPRIVPQGYIKQVFTMNVGLRRNVLNNRGTLSLNVSDLLNTRRFALETTTDAFYQAREFRRESRVITLSFTWRFRNFNDRNNQQNGNGIEGDIDGLF